MSADQDAGWRCFVAVDVDDAARRALDRALAPLRAIRAGVRWTRPEQWHLTCKFLGDVPRGAVEQVRDALRSVGPCAPFTLAVRGLGRFPARGLPRVLWAGIAGDVEAFGALCVAIERAVEPLGHPPERRAFHPHLTLARVKDSRGVREVEAAFGRLAEEVDFAMPPPTTFRLYRSTLTPTGSQYAVVEEFAL